LRGGTHPLAVGPVKPRPLVQARQIRPARRWVPENLGSRPTDRSQDSPRWRQPNRRSDRDPGPRPYARTTSKRGKPGRKHLSTSSLPITDGWRLCRAARVPACRWSSSAPGRHCALASCRPGRAAAIAGRWEHIASDRYWPTRCRAVGRTGRRVARGGQPSGVGSRPKRLEHGRIVSGAVAGRTCRPLAHSRAVSRRAG
jgi:hypothetical protein